MPKEPKGKRETPSAADSFFRSHLSTKTGFISISIGPTPPCPGNSWAVGDLCKAYDWPKTAPGGGVIAIIELGGGWTQADVTQFFTNAKLPAPNITDVSVDGTTNGRCNPKNDADARSGARHPGCRRRLRRSHRKPANIRSTGRRTLPRPLPQPLPTAATCARSPGRGRGQLGRAAQAMRWSRRRSLRRRRHDRLRRVGRQ